MHKAKRRIFVRKNIPSAHPQRILAGKQDAYMNKKGDVFLERGEGEYFFLESDEFGWEGCMTCTSGRVPLVHLDENGVRTFISKKKGDWGHSFAGKFWFCGDNPEGKLSLSDWIVKEAYGKDFKELFLLIADRVKEMEKRIEQFECRCGECGDFMEGEWFDGTELTCHACGAEVVAVEMRDGGWAFPLVENGDN